MALLNNAQLELVALLLLTGPSGDDVADPAGSPAASGQPGDGDPSSTADPADPADPAASVVSCVVLVRNDSGLPLTLTAQAAAIGHFSSAPPSSLAAGTSGQFGFAADAAGRPAAGSLQWIVGDTGAVWSMDWSLSPDGGNGTSTKLAPEQPGIDVDSKLGPGTSNVPISFTVFSRSGPTAAVLSCIVTVRNGSRQPLSLNDKSSGGHGRFATEPPGTLLPGASGQFRFEGEPGAPSISGSLLWDVGDTRARWGTSWTVSSRDGNQANASLAPEQPGFASESRVDGALSVNAPVEFTLSGGEAPSSPAVNAIIEVRNDSGIPLTLQGQSANGGHFAGGPAATVSPGDKALVLFSGEAGVLAPKGTLQWTVGDTGAMWFMEWTLSPDGANGTQTRLGPEQAGLDVDSALGSGTTEVPISFTLFSRSGPSSAVLSCIVNVTNASRQPLSLDSKSSGGHGRFVNEPPGTLAPGASGRFRFEGEPGAPSITGSLLWHVGDTRALWGTSWTVSPRDGNRASAAVAPEQPGFASEARVDTVLSVDAPVEFSLSGGQAPSSPAVNASVEIRNDSAMTLTLKDRSATGGHFAGGPATTVGPGGRTLALFSGEAGVLAPQGGLQWMLGTTGAVWSMDWTLSPEGGNATRTSLVPEQPGVDVDGTLGPGTTEVPISFRVTSGSGPTPAVLSAIIQIRNDSGMPLALTDQSAADAHFDSPPPATLATGASAQLRYVTAPGVLATMGSLQWTLGDSGAVWAMEWTLAVRQGAGDSTCFSTLSPEQAGMQVTSSNGTGATEVPVNFALVGKVAPVPDPPDDDFAPPTASKQPTLHKGDKSPDGWVEYAQRLLIKHKLGVTVNGEFDSAMEKQVRLFQQQRDCQVDGVIGNQTWSMLREAPKEAVGTDGRPAHSFEEKGAQARFVTERPDATGYAASDDRYFMLVVSVGEKSIEGQTVTVRITQPDQTAHTHKIAIGPPTDPSPDGQGNYHKAEIPNFRKTFRIPDAVDPTGCTVDAYLDASLGGDRFTGPVTAPGG